MSVRALYKKLSTLPFGRYLFSRAIGFKAPYFWSVKPRVEQMEPGLAVVSFKNRRAVRNHIGTVHAIAVCNGLELAMGMVAEASIPNNLRWLPKGMTVEYTAKASAPVLRAKATVDPAAFQPNSEVVVEVQALCDDTVVTRGTITLWVTEKPQR